MIGPCSNAHAGKPILGKSLQSDFNTNLGNKYQEGRVSSFSIRLLGMNLQPQHILELFTLAQSVKFSGQFPELG